MLEKVSNLSVYGVWDNSKNEWWRSPRGRKEWETAGGAKCAATSWLRAAPRRMGIPNKALGKLKHDNQDTLTVKRIPIKLLDEKPLTWEKMPPKEFGVVYLTYDKICKDLALHHYRSRKYYASLASLLSRIRWTALSSIPRKKYFSESDHRGFFIPDFHQMQTYEIMRHQERYFIFRAYVDWKHPEDLK